MQRRERPFEAQPDQVKASAKPIEQARREVQEFWRRILEALKRRLG